jgi:hypothetical protein
MHPRVHFLLAFRGSSVVHLLGIVVDQFAAQKVQRRFVIENNVMEGVGENFGHPNQTCLYIFQEKQMDSSKKQTSNA